MARKFTNKTSMIHRRILKLSIIKWGRFLVAFEIFMSQWKSIKWLLEIRFIFNWMDGNKIKNKTGFQTDTLKPLCDWLTVTKSIADWLRAPSSWNQLKNPLKRNGTVTKTRISTTSWTEPSPFPGSSSRWIPGNDSRWLSKIYANVAYSIFQ